MEYMDLLSRLGVSSAHPGGFQATQRLLEKALKPGDLHILEVGCGTGKTACYLRSQGYRVTALDQHPVMLEKAKQRAGNEGWTDIEWVQGSVEELPFEEGTFDAVYAESVTIFTDVPKSLSEYHRVLKPGGRLLDRELVLYSPIPDPVYNEIKDYFKFEKILSLDEWMPLFDQTGFSCDRPSFDSFSSHERAIDPTEIQDLDISALFDMEVVEGIVKYSDLMLTQEQYFRVCDFVAEKS